MNLNGKPAPDIMNIIAELPDPEPQNTDFIKCVKNRELFALNEMNRAPQLQHRKYGPLRPSSEPYTTF